MFFLNFHCFFIPFDLLPRIYDSPLTHHYRSPTIPCDWACSSLGAVRPRAEIAPVSGVCSDAPCPPAPLPLVLFSSPVYQRLYSPRVHSADVKSEECTCSLVAIIRTVSQQRGMAEDEERFESSAELLMFGPHTLTHNLEICHVTDSAEMHLKRHGMLTKSPLFVWDMLEKDLEKDLAGTRICSM